MIPIQVSLRLERSVNYRRQRGISMGLRRLLSKEPKMVGDQQEIESHSDGHTS